MPPLLVCQYSLRLLLVLSVTELGSQLSWGGGGAGGKYFKGFMLTLKFD